MPDVMEIQQLLARYAVGMTQDDIEAVMEVFTPDGTYTAFGATYTLADFPSLVAAAPKGLFLTGTPVLELDGDTGTGQQTLCFVDQTTHDMRIGWYTDTYRRTEQGWRLQTRSMTFLRRSGAPRLGQGRTTHDGPSPRPSPPGDDCRRPGHGARGVQGRGRRVARRARGRAGALDERDPAPWTRSWRSCARSSGWRSTRVHRAWAGPSVSAAWAAPPCSRAYLGEVLTARDLVEPGFYCMPEVLAPTHARLRPAGARRGHGAPAACAATRCGARASRSRAPAATWRRWRAGRRTPTTAGA